MMKNMENRCVFTTKQGHMGIGPFDTQRGDVAVVLLGANVCFVLRPAGPNFELVGDAYIHGVMEGELLEEFRNGAVDARMFRLY